MSIESLAQRSEELVSDLRGLTACKLTRAELEAELGRLLDELDELGHQVAAAAAGEEGGARVRDDGPRCANCGSLAHATCDYVYRG